jgi:hypothetical protein
MQVATSFDVMLVAPTRDARPMPLRVQDVSVTPIDVVREDQSGQRAVRFRVSYQVEVPLHDALQKTAEAALAFSTAVQTLQADPLVENKS